jgi:hypothetical protein
MEFDTLWFFSSDLREWGCWELGEASIVCALNLGPVTCRGLLVAGLLVIRTGERRSLAAGPQFGGVAFLVVVDSGDFKCRVPDFLLVLEAV